MNRLTPATYPATLAQVSIFWAGFQGFPQGTAINVVAGANSAGTANIDGTSLQTVATTSGALGVFTTYTLPNPVTITSGDFVVGFQVPTDPGSLRSRLTLTRRQTAPTLQATGRPSLLSRVQETS